MGVSESAWSFWHWCFFSCGASTCNLRSYTMSDQTFVLVMTAFFLALIGVGVTVACVF